MPSSRRSLSAAGQVEVMTKSPVVIDDWVTFCEVLLHGKKTEIFFSDTGTGTQRYTLNHAIETATRICWWFIHLHGTGLYLSLDTRLLLVAVGSGCPWYLLHGDHVHRWRCACRSHQPSQQAKVSHHPSLISLWLILLLLSIPLTAHSSSNCIRFLCHSFAFLCRATVSSVDRTSSTNLTGPNPPLVS